MSERTPASELRLLEVWDGATSVAAIILGHERVPPRKELEGGGSLRWLFLDGRDGPYASVEFIPEHLAGDQSPLRLVVSTRSPMYHDLRDRLLATPDRNLITQTDHGFQVPLPYERMGSAQDAADQVVRFVLCLRNQGIPSRPALKLFTTIDVEFNVESDAKGKDPDQHSPTLRRFHQLLWSKPLPDGTPFQLETLGQHSYLRYTTSSGYRHLASDSIVHSYRDGFTSRVGDLMKVVDARLAGRVHDDGSTIGGFIVFPGDIRGRKPTINGARGMHGRIADRFDLSLECVRRHYVGESSPLQEPLERYSDFFDLFGDFRGYVDFFLLQDLVSEDRRVQFYLPFDDFQRSPLPQTVPEYEAYASAVLAFVRGRNQRIESWSDENLG